MKCKVIKSNALFKSKVKFVIMSRSTRIFYSSSFENRKRHHETERQRALVFQDGCSVTLPGTCGLYLQGEHALIRSCHLHLNGMFIKLTAVICYYIYIFEDYSQIQLSIHLLKVISKSTIYFFFCPELIVQMMHSSGSR